MLTSDQSMLLLSVWRPASTAQLTGLNLAKSRIHCGMRFTGRKVEDRNVRGNTRVTFAAITDSCLRRTRARAEEGHVRSGGEAGDLRGTLEELAEQQQPDDRLYECARDIAGLAQKRTQVAGGDLDRVGERSGHRMASFLLTSE